MKSSAVYSASPSSLEIFVRRASPYCFWIASISSRTIAQRLSSSLSRPPICRARLRFSSSSLRMIRISSFASRYSFSSRIASVCSASRLYLRHDLLRRVGLAVRLADDLQDLVERVEDLLEALEDVDALLQRLELVLQPPRHDVEAEVEEVPEHRVQIEPLGTADLGVLGRDQARQVDEEVGLERRVLEEVRHHHLLVGVLLHLERDADVFGRQILDVDERRQLAAERDVGDPLDERRLVDGVGDAGDVDASSCRASPGPSPTCRAGGSRRSRSCRSPSARRAS